MTIHVPMYAKVTVQTKVYVLVTRVPETDILVLESADHGDSLHLSEETFVRGCQSGQITYVAPTTATTPTKYSAAPPVSEQKLMEARTRQFLVCEYDALPSSRKKRRFWKEFLVQAIKRAAEAGLTAEVTLRMFEVDVKKGRPGARHIALFVNKRGTVGGSRVSAEIEEILQRVVEFHYKGRNHKLSTCFDAFKAAIDDENKRRTLTGLEPLERPKSMTTLWRRIQQSYNFGNLALQEGSSAAAKVFRGSEALEKYKLPKELIVVDNTVIDIHAVDPETGLLLGRPILSIAICVTTRCIVGYIISFEPPSNGRLISLIKNIIYDKSYAKRIAPDLYDDWNHFGLFHEILFDRALENQSRGLKESCASIGINVSWAPPHSPQHKAWVESLFRTFNELLFHLLPGAVAHDPKRMRELQLNPATTATLDVRELEAKLIKAISAYENREHSGTRKIPSLHMRSLLKEHPGRMLQDVAMIDELIADVAEVNLWSYGINFRGNLYENPEATTALRDALLGRQYAKRAKGYGRKSAKVQIRFDPQDCSRVVAFAEVQGQVRSYEFLNRFRDTERVSFRLDAMLRKQAREANRDYQDKAERVKFRLELAANTDALLQVGDRSQRALAKAWLDLQIGIERDLEETSVENDTLSVEDQVVDQAVTLVSPPGQSPTRASSQQGAPRRGAKKAARTKAVRADQRDRLRQMQRAGDQEGTNEPDRSHPDADVSSTPDLPSFL